MQKNLLKDFEVTTEMMRVVTSKIQSKKTIFSFEEDPFLASLVASIGIQKEMGDPSYDRLSAALNIDLKNHKENPWRSKIVSHQDKIGVCLWIEGGGEFYPDHPDFAEILDFSSLNESKKLSQIVIFPTDVAKNYKKRGLELVIVKPWVLNSLFSDREQEVNYFKTNLWEIELNSAKIQTEMMARGQVSFSGTHDLVDHLLFGQGEGLNTHKDFYKEFFEAYKLIFPGSVQTKKVELVVSYLIGVLLDDLAQPKWYGSEIHREVAQKSLRFLESLSSYDKDQKALTLPMTFHTLIGCVRSQGEVGYVAITAAYENFVEELMGTVEDLTAPDGLQISPGC